MRIVLVIFLLCFCPLKLFAEESVRVSYRVICDDGAVAAKISAAIERELKKSDHYELVDKFPSAKLLLYANKDIGDRKNPEGWSIAVAHVSNLESIYLASKIINDPQPEIAAVTPVLVAMINEEGFLKHFSVAHLDEMSDREVDLFSQSVVSTFLEKISAYTRLAK